MKHLSLLIAVIFCISNSLSAHAGESVITHTLIVEKNQQMEETLKKRDPIETIDFLHNNISEDADFNIQVNNPTAPAAQDKQSFKMSKADYINLRNIRLTADINYLVILYLRNHNLFPF